MVTINQYPQDLSAAGNPVIIELRPSASSFYETQGVKAAMSIRFNELLSAGDAYTITYQNGARVVKFTAANVPDDSGYQIPVGTGTIQSWLVEVIAAMRANYWINKHFIVWQDDTMINLEAIEFGSEYTIDLYVGTLDMGIISETAGEDRQVRENYLLGLQIYMVERGQNIFVLEEKNSVSISPVGLIYKIWDIAEILKSQLSSSFEFFPVNKYIVRDQMCKQYFFKYFEQFGPNSEPQKLTTVSGKYAFGGAVSNYKFGDFIKNNTNFFENLKSEKFFLTNHPDHKKIDHNYYDKLYFIVYKTLKTIQVKVNAVFTDASSHDFDFTIPDIQVPLMTEVELNINTRILGIFDYCLSENKNLASFTVGVHGDGAIIIISRTYIFDDTYYPTSKTLLFKNSFGAYDVLRCTGMYAEEEDISKDEISVSDAEKKHLLKRRQNINLSVDNSVEINTGWLNRIVPDDKAYDMMRYLQELSLSEEVYEVKGLRIFPVVITSKKIIKHESDNFNYAVSFSYSYADIINAYSADREAPDGDFNNDFNNDFNI